MEIYTCFDTQTGFVIFFGFIKNNIDECISNLKANDREICMAIYVDHIFKLSQNESDIL
jgi:hypothetical protein